MGEFLLVAVVALGCAVSVQAGTPHLEVTVTPPYAHVRPQDSLTVTCHASAPISHCELKVAGVIYDLSNGSSSHPHDGVTYHGEGLAAGDCGFTIDASLVFKRLGSGYPVTCRVRGRDSDWTYGLMAVLASDNDVIPLSVDKHLLVAQPGGQLNILYRLGGPVSKCLASFEGWHFKRSLDVSRKGACTDASNICSYGNGVEAMECGVTVKNVTEDMNGVVWFHFHGPSGKRDGVDFVLVIVARPPSTPVLTFNVTVAEGAPAVLHAECLVEGARPAASVAWYLDGRQVSRSAARLRYVPHDAWAKLSNVKTTRRTLTRQLTDGEIGRELWCVAEHPTLGASGRPSRRVKIQVPTCPPLVSETLVIDCYLGGEKTDCAAQQQVGTVAQFTCKPGYVAPPDNIFRRTTCDTTSNWDHEIFKCTPECGKRKSNRGTVLISKGDNATVGEFPWHVAIYRQVPGTATPVQICGGSLITSHVVVTAAHCFYNNTVKKMEDASEYRVAAGKHSRAWADDHVDVQRRNVTSISHHLYGGRDRNFAADIALVYLSEALELNTVVNLVCIDWENVLELQQLEPGKVGVVAGWGLTEEGSQSDHLQFIDLPYIPQWRCYESLPVEVKPILTPDKICAGHSNQSRSVCGGDSGGGLAFREARRDKYYLRGVVSVAFKPADFSGGCYADQYVGFTLVSQYLTWMRGTLSSFARARLRTLPLPTFIMPR